MAKRHHHKKQDFRDRMHEHEGMERHKGHRGMHERHKGAMINDERSAPCNLPQMVMEKYWPNTYNKSMGYVDDLFDGVNRQMHEDYGEMSRMDKPRKY